MIDIQALLTYLTLISVPVGVTYHIMTLNNTRKNQQQQLETRQAQLFMQMYNKWDESLRESFRKIRGIEFEDFSDFIKKYGPDSEEDMEIHIARIAYFLEGMGVLVKEDLVSMRLVALTWAGTTRMFWDKISPIIEDWRKAISYPRLWSETEYLCTELIKYMEEHPELAT
jgi:hypothetical protein